MNASSSALPGLFRTCPVTGLKVHGPAENLIKANAVVAVVTFLVGLVAALLLALTRWQAVHLLPADWYYRLVTAHGLNMLIFFIIFFEMAVLYFAGPILLNARLPMPKVGWLAFVLMVVGAILVEYSVFTGQADVMFTSYPPLRANPNYYLGIILFAVGALLVTILFFATLIVAKKERTYEGSVPLVTFGALTAAIIAVITLLHGAIIMIPAWLWSMDLMPMDPQVYRLIFWALGHSSQQINVAAMVSIWYFMAGITIGGVVLNEKISRLAFVLYILFISMASAHHLLVDPGFGPAWKVVNTSYFMYMAVLASMIHGFTVPAGMEVGMRLRGYTKGLFEWLQKAPWSDPGFSATFLSLVIFGFLGGVTGVVIGTEQINIIAHNTLRIPGHFHVTVVGGTALAFMGVTYYVVPLIFRKQIVGMSWARIQPYIFGAGIVIMATGMTIAGMFGVPRRHWDISFTQAPFKVEFPAASDMALGLLGIGGIIAFVGGLIYTLVVVASVFFGPSYTEEMARTGKGNVPAPLHKLPPQVHNKDEHHAPGTMVLVFIFLAVFAVYFFTNWKVLSMIWKVG
ncbi:MAG: cbb3-type cytochrome c oxidase subunit I [Deltaproteobacteria bacterium]|nr:cbb3-type cytochrome c oxidase subunit I [Deltaproteobacteria bacterium]